MHDSPSSARFRQGFLVRTCQRFQKWCAASPAALEMLSGYGVAVIGDAPTVMPGLGPGIHEFARDNRNLDGTARRESRHLRSYSPDFAVAHTDNSWMPGPRPGMTTLSLTPPRS